MRFFFHTQTGDKVAIDAEGADHADLAAAMKDALAAARELLGDAIKSDGNPPDKIIVANRSGSVLGVIYLKHILPASMKY